MMLNTWYECLKDLEYNLVLEVVKTIIGLKLEEVIERSMNDE